MLAYHDDEPCLRGDDGLCKVGLSGWVVGHLGAGGVVLDVEVCFLIVVAHRQLALVVHRHDVWFAATTRRGGVLGRVRKRVDNPAKGRGDGV